MDETLLPPGGVKGFFDLTGHVSVITGGNSGIGLGMAAGLVATGATVQIWGSNAGRNAAAVERLQGGPGAITSRTVDVGDEQEVVRAMADVYDEHRRLDSCFVNAGVTDTAALVETTVADFQRVTRVNIDGSFVTLREAAKHMIAAGNGGSLVGASSMSTRFGQARYYAYAASKASVLAFMQAAAVELARYNIRANALLPGWTESNITSGPFSNERFVEKVMPRMPIRRWGTPADFAGIAVYMASPASAFHTGDAILMDGGYSAF